MDPIKTILPILTIISFFIALYNLLYKVLKDRPKIVILDTRPGLGGQRSGEEPWRFSVSSVSVRIKNAGKRPAMRVKGVVSFGKLDALPLYPTKEGNVIFQTEFDLAPEEEKNLVAAWNFSGNAIDGTKAMSSGEFIDKAPPIKVTIEYIEGKISKEYTRSFLENLIRKHEENHYLHG